MEAQRQSKKNQIYDLSNVEDVVVNATLGFFQAGSVSLNMPVVLMKLLSSLRRRPIE